MSLILILTPGEYEDDMRLRGGYLTTLSELKKQLSVLSYMRPTSSRPGGTVPKCNDGWSTTHASVESRYFCEDLGRAKRPAHANKWHLINGQITLSLSSIGFCPLKETPGQKSFVPRL